MYLITLNVGRLMPVYNNMELWYDVKKEGKSTRYKSNVYTNNEMPEAFCFSFFEYEIDTPF